MDLSSLFSLLLPSLLSIIFVVVKRAKSKNKFPPGPWKLPIIGNLHQLLGPQPPHRRLRDLANKHGPLMSLHLGQIPYIIISSPEVAKQILKTHDTIFANRPMFLVVEFAFYNGEDMGFSPYGEYWRQLRKICAQELLHAKRVRSFRGVREEHVLSLVTSCCNSGGRVINLSESIFSLNYSMVPRIAFGQISTEQEGALREISNGILEVLGGFSIAELFPSITFLQVVTGIRSKLEKLHQETNKILDAVISDHRCRKISGKHDDDDDDDDDDLVGILLNLQHPPLSDNSIKALLFDLFLGGSHIAAITVEWAMSELMRHPETMEKAQAEVRQVFDKIGKVCEEKIDELKYLKLVVKETLRLHPPAPLLIPRETSEACEIDGYCIAAKTRVIVNAWAIGRDANHWTEAERFNPERFIDYRGSSSFDYLPFGGGRRICPGILFGLAAVELPLASLLYHFEWELPGESLDMVEAFGLAAGKKNNLELIPVLHRPILLD